MVDLDSRPLNCSCTCVSGYTAAMLPNECRVPQCHACSECPEGYFQVENCTSQFDTGCTVCFECQSGTFADPSLPCEGMRDTTCDNCTVCGEGEQQVSPCNATADAVCCTDFYVCIDPITGEEGGCTCYDPTPDACDTCPPFYTPLTDPVVPCEFNCNNGACPMTCPAQSQCINTVYGHNCTCTNGTSPVVCPPGTTFCNDTQRCLNNTVGCPLVRCPNATYPYFCSTINVCVTTPLACPAPCPVDKPFPCVNGNILTCFASQMSCTTSCVSPMVQCPTQNGTCTTKAACQESEIFCRTPSGPVIHAYVFCPCLPSNTTCPSPGQCFPNNVACPAYPCLNSLVWCQSLGTCVYPGQACNVTCV